MIVLHRLGRANQAFHLNPDLFLMVEATPDTVITTTSGQKLLVAESPEEVAAAVLQWRSTVIATALRAVAPATRRAARNPNVGLALVRAATGTPPVPPAEGTDS